MNRLIAILIAVCYLCASTGFTLHEHYCMGKHVSSTLLAQSDTHKCERCGMVKSSSKNDCCKDKQKIVKADDDAALTKTFTHSTHTLDAGVIPNPVGQFPAAPDVPVSEQQTVSGRPHGPPLFSSLRLHVRNCVFLI